MTYFTAQLAYDRLTKLDKRVLSTGHHCVLGHHTMGRETLTMYAINIASTRHRSASGHHTMGCESAKRQPRMQSIWIKAMITNNRAYKP